MVQLYSSELSNTVEFNPFSQVSQEFLKEFAIIKDCIIIYNIIIPIIIKGIFFFLLIDLIIIIITPNKMKKTEKKMGTNSILYIP
jgi:hypothetical protein